MHRATIMEPPGFDKLSKAEQIGYLQHLWDLISKNPAEIPVPESHLRLVEERLQEYRKHPENTHRAYDILDRLSNKPR